MPESDSDVPGFTVFVLEPGFVAIRLSSGWAGYVIDSPAQFITKTQAGQNIGDQSQAFPAGSFLTPEPWFVGIHSIEKFTTLPGLQDGGYFITRANCSLPVPLWYDTGVNTQ